MKKIVFISAVLISIFAVSAAAQTRVRVKFGKGMSSATVRGTVKGYNYIDYLVRAKSGQTISVSLNSKHGGCSFVVFHSNMENVENGTDVREFSATLDADDDYVIRVLLPRSAARRKESAAYSLKVAVD